MARKFEDIDDETFEATIMDNPVVLVDFWAIWCGPCRAMNPVVEEIARRYEGRILITKMNVDEQKVIPARFKIVSIPTLILFVEGKEVAVHVGAQSIDKIAAWLDKHLPAVVA